MSKLTLILIVVIGLPVLAIVGLMLVLDNPELFRERIASTVKEQSGFELKINGGMDWRFFPPIAINIDDIEVIPPGSSTPLASLKSASVDIKILPLIMGGTVEVDGLSIDGLILNAVVDKNGQANWTVEDAEASADEANTSNDTENAENKSTSDGAAMSLNVQSFSLTNTEINYQDKQANEHYILNIASLTTGALKPGQLTDLNGEIHFNDKIGKMQASTTLDGRFGISETLSEISLEQFHIKTKIEAEEQATLTPQITLNGSINTDAGTAELKDSKLQISDLILMFSINANNIYQVPGLRGSIEIPSFNAKTVASDFGVELPAMASDTAMTKVSLQADITGTTSQLVMSNLKLMLDSSTLTGKATATMLPKLGLAFNLKMDAINASDYLEATVESTGDSDGGASAPVIDSELIPVQMLSEMDLNGTFTLGKLNYETYELSDIKTSIKNKRGSLDFSTSAKAFDGELSLTSNLKNVKPGKQVQGRNTLTVSGINVSKVAEFEALTGTVAFNSQTSFSGKMMSELVNSLDGKSTFSVTNGTLDVSSVKKAAAMVASIQGKTNDVAAWPDKMPFTEMLGTHSINQGLSADQKLSFVTEFLEVDGGGGLDYFANTINYDIRAELIQAPDSKFKVNEQLTGIKWPLHCEGNLDDGAASLCLPNQGSITDLLKQLATKQLKAKGKEKLLEALPDKYKDKAKDLFKGLFN